MANAGVARELWGFMRARKKWWLLPIIIVMALLGLFIAFAQGSVLAPPLPFGLWVRRNRQSASPLGQQFAALCREVGNAFMARFSVTALALWTLQGLGSIQP